ncbi:hypothetical protein [Ekhidna sp.]
MKKTTLTIFVACIMLLPLTSFDWISSADQGFFYIPIDVTGGNGTSDGEQVNRDYEFTVDIPLGCTLASFKVLDGNSTSSQQVVGNKLFLVWKPSYVGTTQTIEAVCSCPYYFPPSMRVGIGYENYTLHN